MDEVTIRLIEKRDLEKLRLWKNAHKNRFFFQDDISPEDQENWYKGYGLQKNNHMYIVEVSLVGIGCMGIRLMDDYWDVYNVILGETAFSKKGYMSVALKKMIKRAQSTDMKRGGLVVLRDNPAVNWYLSNSFQIFSTGSKSHEMRYSILS
jgi:RimJ/RimL family protein N-acetyltransferase